jgi:hypothetical protein
MMRTIRNPGKTIAIALLLAVLPVYILGYLLLPARINEFGVNEIELVFDHDWQASIYRPAAFIEGILTKCSIETCTPYRE